MKEFRDRVLIPTLVPLAALAIIVVVVLNISRVLLALEDRSGPHTVTAVAIIIASGILFGFTYFSSKGEGQSTASLSLMSVAGIMVILAGFFGAEAIHEDEQEARAKAAEAAEANKPDLIVEAFDIGFKEKELRIGPGKVRIQEVNTGATAHTFELEGVSSGRKLSVPSGGSKDTAAFDLQAGTYTYFCDIAGHRQAGMEGKLIVDPSAPAPGSGGGGGGGGAAAGAPLNIDAADLSFTPKEATVAPGAVAVTYKNGGAILHTLVVDGDGSFAKLSADPGKTVTGTWNAKPGSYTLFCDIPGHRQAGMETKVTVGAAGSTAPAAAGGGATSSSGPAASTTTAGSGGGAAAGGPVDVEAGDLFFKPKEFTAKSGAVPIKLTNKGAIPHNLVVAEDPSFKKIDLTPGASGTGTLNAKPGIYTLYCDLPGHRQAGMEAKLTVS
jgi:plastocyanin